MKLNNHRNPAVVLSTLFVAAGGIWFLLQEAVPGMKAPLADDKQGETAAIASSRIRAPKKNAREGEAPTRAGQTIDTRAASAADPDNSFSQGEHSDSDTHDKQAQTTGNHALATSDPDLEKQSAPSTSPSHSDTSPEADQTRGSSHSDHWPRLLGGLEWLEDHQSRGVDDEGRALGYWSAARHRADSLRAAKGISFSGSVEPGAHADTGLGMNDVALTSTALLAFLSNGHTHRDGQPSFKHVIATALQWLSSQQGKDGSFGSPANGDFVLTNALAAAALCETYEMTRDPNLRAASERAIAHLLTRQNHDGGWPGDAGNSDGRATFWAVHTLRAAQLAEIPFDHSTVYERVNAWLDGVEIREMDDGEEPVLKDVRTAAWTGGPPDAAMDAMNMWCRLATEQLNVQDHKIELLGRHVRSALAGTTRYEKLDLQQLFIFAECFRHMLTMDKSNDWLPIADRLRAILLKHQRGWHEADVVRFVELEPSRTSPKNSPMTGRPLFAEQGSWDPVDAFGAKGGRIWSTAMVVCVRELLSVWGRIVREPPHESD